MAGVRHWIQLKEILDRSQIISTLSFNHCSRREETPWRWQPSSHNRVVSRDKDECTPDSVPMVFIVFNLGILGDEKTHKYPLYRAYFIGYVGRGTSNYPLMVRLGIMYRISSSPHVSYRCGAGPGTKPPKNYHDPVFFLLVLCTPISRCSQGWCASKSWNGAEVLCPSKQSLGSRLESFAPRKKVPERVQI